MMDWQKEVQARKEELLADLFALLRIESTKDLDSKSEGRPMGQKIGEALELILQKADQAGFKTKNLDGYAGYAQYGDHQDQELIGILCHVDVVPATGEWTSPPFEPTIRDGKIFARGAIDDKGPTMAAFYGLKIVKELGLPLSKDVRMIFGTDEESGMSCMRYYQEVEGMPSAGFAPDADFPIINAEKGQITAKLSLQNNDDSAGLALHSFHAGSRVNMVPEKAKALIVNVDNDSFLTEFESYCTKHQFKNDITIDGKTIELTLYGLSAHAMEPFVGMNAATALAGFLKNYPFQQSARTYLQFVAELHQDFYGESLGIAYRDDVTGPLTVNPGILSYEQGKDAFVIINARIPVTTNYEKIKNQLQRVAEQKGFTVPEMRESQPHYVDSNHPMIKGLQKAYEEETGQVATLLSTGGATYARFMKHGVAFGANFPGKEMTAHQKDEFIEIDDLLKATAVYAHAIYEIAK